MDQTKKKIVSVKDLLASGAHFGHQKKRWNPKMKRYIFEERNGIYIIDLSKTVRQIENATQIVVNAIEKHQRILFVGTKKQAKVVIREFAEKCGEFYVCERWLGGMLTNLITMRQSVKALERIEKQIVSGGDGLTKKEMTLLMKERSKLDKNLSGVRGMRKIPGLLVVVDPNKEHIAIAEANKLGIPIVALVDTNCDPDPIDHVIACNDDALKTIKLIIQFLTEKIIECKNELSIAIEIEEKAERLKQETHVAEEIVNEEKSEKGELNR